MGRTIQMKPSIARLYKEDPVGAMRLPNDFIKDEFDIAMMPVRHICGDSDLYYWKYSLRPS